MVAKHAFKKLSTYDPPLAAGSPFITPAGFDIGCSLPERDENEFPIMPAQGDLCPLQNVKARSDRFLTSYGWKAMNKWLSIGHIDGNYWKTAAIATGKENNRRWGFQSDPCKINLSLVRMIYARMIGWNWTLPRAGCVAHDNYFVISIATKKLHCVYWLRQMAINQCRYIALRCLHL